MYFLWKTTSIGIIRVSGGGLKDFADDAVRSRLRLYSITLSPADKKGDADVSIVFSDEDVAPETRTKVEEHFPAVMKPMGIKASVIWASPERSVLALLGSPYVWAGVVSCCAVMVTAGASGFFWVMFWAATAWFGVSGLKLIARKFRSV